MERRDQEFYNVFKKYKALKKMKDTSHLAMQTYFAKRLEALQLFFDRLHGARLRDRLFEVYDELCPDDEIKDILEYFSLKEDERGVQVSAYDFPGVQATVSIRLFPMRIEMKSLTTDYKEILWSAA
ncbi:hypothetical protein [Roseivirga sp. UBA838]|uniref:hypothetical protein n=1 Tax=Roseivirga sp. UBA838 TaxID=1947393 RepID=UPI002580632C|nr:hypothetical protein [Roseivirga sp. UBA838]|tara:strand:- start:12128 stop:12505 length:378 start_codon:yes stop_codon:yes gene_type:complete